MASLTSETKNTKTMIRKSKMRLLKDVSDIIKNPLTDQGIYYVHDEDNMMKGYAVVFGPSETLYQYGAYFFEFSFPCNYPFTPPKLSYMTNNGKTRFNPNLYRNGKVCISILNTWKGEQWTSCQTIRSVLLTLTTLLHNKPLLNEPGFKENHHSFKLYNDIIKYQNYKTAIHDVLTKKLLPGKFKTFYSVFKNNILKNKEIILEDLRKLKDSELNDKEIYCSVYGMNDKLCYSELYDNILSVINKL